MPKNIIIIDDDNIQRTLFKELISQRKNSQVVVEAVDGLDGLRKIENQDFDLIICDNYMPKKKGLELIQELISHHHYSPSKFMFVSGDLEASEVHSLAKLGVKSILLKPVSVKRFLEQINSFHSPE